MEELKPYEIDEKIILGRGSFGTVYKAIHNYKDKDNKDHADIVALKKLPEEIKNDKEKLESLSNEIMISTELNKKNIKEDNENLEKNNKDEDKDKDKEEKFFDEGNYEENLVKFIDIVNIDDNVYLAYEFCNGGDLKRYLKYFKRFNERMVQRIMKQIIQGLNYLHERKIFHHDLKPENILVELCDEKGKPLPEEEIKKILDITNPKNKSLNQDESIMKNEDLLKILYQSKMKISDFGLSKLQEEVRFKEVSGSPLYIDPNSLNEETELEGLENEKVDIWALGIMAYELLFYDLPFQPFPPSIERLKIAFDKGIYTIDFSKCKEISKEFLIFLDMCLQRDQTIRPLTDELLYTEFIIRDPECFVKINKDNYTDTEKFKYPDNSYLKEKGKITMNIDNNRMLSSMFDR